MGQHGSIHGQRFEYAANGASLALSVLSWRLANSTTGRPA